MRTANLNKSNNIAQGPQPSETDSSSTPPRHSSSFQPAMQSFASQIRIHGNSDLRPTGKESSLNSDADSDYEWEHSPGPGHQPEWDSVIKKFLSAAGLIQALRGFESDMVILNPDWERKIIPRALGGLLKQLLVGSSGFFRITLSDLYPELERPCSRGWGACFGPKEIESHPSS